MATYQWVVETAHKLSQEGASKSHGTWCALDLSVPPHIYQYIVLPLAQVSTGAGTVLAAFRDGKDVTQSVRGAMRARKG